MAKNDKKIDAKVKELKSKAEEFLGLVTSFNHDAWSDRTLEELIDLGREVETLHKANFN